MSTIETATEAALLTAAEEAALNVLMAGPLVGVHVRIAVKFRAMKHDLGTVTVIDHSWQWPVPALFATANPHPVALNTHGIQLDVTLSQPAAVTAPGGIGRERQHRRQRAEHVKRRRCVGGARLAGFVSL